MKIILNIFIILFFIVACKVPVYLRILVLPEDNKTEIIIKRYLLKYNIANSELKKKNNTIIKNFNYNNIDSAMEEFKNLSLKYKDSIIYYNLGIIYEMLGRNIDAEKSFQKSCSISPENEFFREAYLRVFPTEIKNNLEIKKEKEE